MFSFILFVLLFTGQQDQIKIKDAWIRPGAQDMNTAMYFTIKNNGSVTDTLYAVKSKLAQKTEVHETYSKDGMMGMRKAELVVIKPKSSFEFKPGGHHIMLIKLNKDLKSGNEGEITLFFKKTGEVKVKAKVKKPDIKKGS
jgi:copper(I)-binding protein